MYCIETNDLTYNYSLKASTIDNINLKVPKGSIYGFLGPNGAGKTTTIRLLLGLLKKQKGSIKIFGQSFEKNRIKILKNVGSLIESPSFYSQLTATENLNVLQKIYQFPNQRIQEVLQIVGLADTGKKKASQFSLGMKQRLSIAIAIIHKPSLLILDEPTNGLDPTGIIEIRDLLKKINHEQGVSIVISSHLLSEIERLVTDIGIINKGKMLFQGTLETLKQQQKASSIIIETNNDIQTKEIIENCGLKTSIIDGKLFTPIISKQLVAKINQQLVNNGIEVYQISIVKNDLESIFIDIMNN